MLFEERAKVNFKINKLFYKKLNKDVKIHRNEYEGNQINSKVDIFLSQKFISILKLKQNPYYNDTRIFYA